MVKLASVADAHAAVACLGRLAEVFRQRRQALASSVGLTEQQWSVLDEIDSESFMPSLFARQRESSAAAVSKILRQLQDKELVVVSLHESDGRQRHYELSGRGKRVLAELRAQRQHAIDEVWRAFDAETLQGFTRFGAELLERLERYSEQRDSEHASQPARLGPGNGKDVIR